MSERRATDSGQPVARARRTMGARPDASRPVAPVPEFLVPYRRMAMHVIARAFRDLTSPTEAAAARAFLADSPMLRHWSTVAALDASTIAASARLLIATLAASPAAPEQCLAPRFRNREK